MNPFLIFLIIIAAIFLWILCSFLYKPIGKLFDLLFKDVKNAISESEDSKKKE